MKKTTLRQAALKLALVAVALLAPLGLRAQDLADYTFSTGTDASKWKTVTSETLLLVSGGDASASALQSIGFSFPFGEETYTQFSVNTDGNLRLGGTATTTSAYSTPFSSSNANSNNPKINAFGCDGYATANNYVKYQVFNDNLLVVEFCMNTYSQRSTTTLLFKWQIHLYSNGDIEIVFPGTSELPATNPSVAHQCGLCINKNDGWVITLSDNQATHFTNGSSTTNSSGTWFDANRYYKFARPVIACPKPTGVTASNILHNEATIGWTSTESAWQIVYSTDENFDPDAASPIPAATTSYTISELTPLTDYYAYVRSNCTASNNGYSDWSTKVHFKTTAVATVVGDSWSDNFEGGSCGWELINGTQTNQWVWGTAVNNGGTHALYVSNDGGTSNTYGSGGTKIFAAKLLSFAASKYEFSYDWKCNGESTYDFMRVALVPALQTLTAGTDYSTISTTSLPSGWIALDGGGKLNLQGTSWQNKNVTINVAAGNYYIVLVWRNDSDGGGSCDPPAAVDNVSITRVACPYDVTDLAVNSITTSGATVTWTAGEATQWQVAYSTASNFEGATEETVNAATYPMTSLTDATHYYVRVRAYCGGSDYGSWSDVVEFDTKCNPIVVPNEGWTENFDGLSVASAYTAPAARVLPTCWKAINTTTYSTYKPFPTAYYYSSTNYAHSTPNCLKLYSCYSSSWSEYDPQPQYAILPEMSNLNDDMRIKLWAKGYNASSTFKIGRMTDPTDAGTFVAFEIASGVNEQALTTSYQEFTYNIPTAANGNYIAIMIDAANSSRTYNGVYIDDILVEPIPSCTEPSDLEFVSSTTNTATLGWTAVGTETAWDIYVSTVNVAPTNSTAPTVSATADNPATVSDLTASTTYYAWVRAHCGDDEGQQSPWIGGISFQTECEAVTSFPWVENFESFAANTVALCWDNSATTGTDYGSHPEYYWGVYEYNGNKMIRMYNFYAHGPLAIINTPTINLPAEPKELTFYYTHNASSGNFIVKISEDNGSSFVDLQSYSKGTGSSNTDPGTFTEATISLSDYTNKSVILQFYSAANYGSGAIFVDNIKIDNIPTCRKPSGLTVDNSATTAHTATLSWTNGNSETAWQIAYSTDANFDPNSVTPVGVTTNPATITVPNANTTYYAYVRANCGNDDYSAWCNTKVSFTTPAGNVTPTGLAVAGNTITSIQATASWNAVAGNTQHQSYDIYWAESSVTEVPAEPDAPNLIAGITGTSQVIDGLAAETNYKVWVRDNCGTDGYSNWSSPVTFATAASCQTPDGLAASNVTNNSATISWNTYGQTGFNLRYSTDGENWTTTNEPVSTPYILNGVLDGNTAYQVQVQASCNTEEWSTTLNFTTKCDAITTFPISYGFETSEGFPTGISNAYSAPTTNNLGNCWRNEATSTTGSYYSRLWCTGTTYKNGSQSLMLPDKGSSSTHNTTLLAFPAMNFTSANGYKVSFWIYRPNFLNSGTNYEGFKVYVSHTDTIDAGAVDLGLYSRYYNVAYPQIEAANGWYQYDIYIPQATITGTVFLIFEGQSYYGSSTYVDDITIDEAPSCYPVGTLADATNVEARSARLSWTLVDANQNAWQVAYKADGDADFTINNAATHENYVLQNLAPETHYTVKVRANCGGDDQSEWSNIIDFTTNPTCFPVGTLTYANVGTHSAELSWVLVDDNQDNWDVQYATNDAFNEGVQTVADVDVNEDYTLSGLTPETHYWVRVRANCGNVDGYGAWSNAVDFTTGIACPAPTALTLDASTTETLTISWTGSADTWIVAYKEAESLGDFTTATTDATNPYTITGLTDGTLYTVRVRANCGNVNGLSQWLAEDFQTEASCPSPYDLAVTDASETAHGAEITWNGNAENDSYTVEYAEGPLAGLATLLNEGFEGGSMPAGWSHTGSTWTVGSGSGNNSGVSTAANGTYNATFYNGSATPEYLITPAINLEGVLSATLTFNYVNPAWSGGIYSLTVYYRVGEGAWQELETYNTAQASWTQKTINLTGLADNYQIGFYAAKYNNDYGYGTGIDDVKITAEYTPGYTWNELATNATSPYVISTLDPETQYVVRVKGVCGSTPSPASNIAGFTTLEACGAPTAFVLGAVEAHQATFSWTTGIANTAWKVYVKEHGAAEYPVAYTNANTTSVTIDGLEDNTAYDVKIVPTCNESKILEVENAFTTECDAIAIPAEGWTEDFNSYDGNSTSTTVPAGYPDHTMPDCWKFLNLSETSDTYPQAFLTSNSSYAVSGNCLFFKSSTSTPLYAILPKFTNNTSSLAITFTYRNEGTNASNGTIIVGYMTDPTDASTFTPVLTCDKTITRTTKTATFADAPAGSYIAFKYQGGTSNNYFAAIDDVTVKPYSVEKAITANKWYAISSPVHNSDNDETLAGVTNLTSGTYDLYGYTESAGTWNKPTTVLEQGKGYIYRRAADATLSFVGTPNSGGISYDLSYACSDNDLKGFNLVGNPYPQAATPGMVCYSLTPAGLWYAQLATYNAAVCEAVLVKTGSPDNEVSFSTGAKGYNDTPALAFTVSNEEFEDVTYAMLDNGDGLPKIGHIATNAPELSIPVAGRRYAIATLGAEAESFELNFRGIGGEYTLTLNAQRSTLNYCHLIDRATNKEIDLLGQPTYTFNATGSDGSRFLVKLKPDAETVNTTFAIWNGEAWVVNGNGTLQVFDVLGRQLLRQDIQGSEYRIQNTQFPGSGVYILRLGDKSQKIVVK